VDEELNPNAPTPRQAARIRVPESRHRASRVGLRSQVHGDVNTVAMPWVDFGEDLAAILAGRAIRNGNHFLVNSREYVLEGEGRLCPIVGEGFIPLGRGSYRALGMYNEWGLTEFAEARVNRARIREDEREAARQVWRLLQEWRQERD
jgi:hypothetical protein